MKQFYGRWKFSKKQQAMVWKWKKRKVRDVSFAQCNAFAANAYNLGRYQGARTALRICEEMLADMPCVDMEMSLINKRKARDVIRKLQTDHRPLLKEGTL